MNESKIDPVFRCDSCQALVLLKTIHKIGCCQACGNKRVRNVTIFNEDEHAQMKAWGLDDFLAEFEGVADEQ